LLIMRLYQQVRRKLELVNEISAGTYTPLDPGLFVVSAQLTPEKTEAAVKAILAELWSLAESGVGSEELQRAKLNAKAEYLQSRATMSGEAQNAAHYEALDGDYRKKDHYLTEVDQVTVENLTEIAARYLRPENLTITVMLPKEAESKLDQTAILTLAAAAAPKPKVGASSVQPATFHKYQLKNGVRLLIKADHSLPLVSVRAAFLGGSLYETDRDSGLTNFLTKVWDKGTTRLSAEALARETEDIGAGLNAFSGFNSFGLEGEFLGQYLDRSLDLLADLLLHPAFDPAEVEKVRPNIKAAILRQRDELSARTFKLFRQTLYGSHPYSRDILGTEATVNRFTAQDLKSYYQRFVRPDNAVLAVVGDVDPDRIKSRLEELLSGWNGNSGHKPVIGPPSTWKGVKSALDPVDRAQTHLVLGYLAADMLSPDRYALDLLHSVLSGQSGRMFVKLRDEQSLAYALTSFYRPGLGTGFFGLYIAFEPAKLEKVQAGLKDLLAELYTNPITAEELNGAKQYIMGNYEVGQQTNGAQAGEAAFNELYGLGYDYPAKYLSAISAVTPEDVMRVAKRYLNPDQAAQVIVGKVQGSGS
ncbi:MAG: insulinase family protein, partial [Deltaproteobacteria bacterium]|nr:insulinase family protein [Deltaproteobacteria bacterium]